MRDARTDLLIRARFGVYRADAERWLALSAEAYPERRIVRYLSWAAPVVAVAFLLNWILGVGLLLLFLIPVLDWYSAAKKARQEQDALFLSNVPYWSSIQNELCQIGLISLRPR